jgi:hypothetical protein
MGGKIRAVLPLTPVNKKSGAGIFASGAAEIKLIVC